MTSESENAEIRALRDRVGDAEITLGSLNVKAERISEIVVSLGNLEARVRALEEHKGQLAEMVAYKGTSDGRITSLEQTTWYYKGGLNTILVLFFSSGILGVILGVIISQGIFHS
jgi:hypothetical protein